MNILFISRAFPPIIGGIENQNAALSEWLGKKIQLTTIANTRGKSFLPLFLPWALIQTLWKFPQYDLLLLGDGVLAPLGAILKFCFPSKTVVSVVHGLDITFANDPSWLGRCYAKINLPALQKLDGIIAVSQETKRLALHFGLFESRVFIIPNGIDPAALRGVRNREALSDLLKIHLTSKKVIIRIGRFVKHKGVAWFLRNVVPILPNDVVFVAAGGAPQKATPGDANIYPECEEIVRELHLESRVRLLKNAPWSDIKLLLNSSDLAVAPNIPVPGSFEGFGISAIEAGVCGLPIVASKLEGLQEAIHDGKNGFLVPPQDAQGFIQKIEWLLNDAELRRQTGKQAEEYVLKNFSWDDIATRYIELLHDFQKSTHDTH